LCIKQGLQIQLFPEVSCLLQFIPGLKLSYIIDRYYNASLSIHVISRNLQSSSYKMSLQGTSIHIPIRRKTIRTLQTYENRYGSLLRRLREEVLDEGVVAGL